MTVAAWVVVGVVAALLVVLVLDRVNKKRHGTGSGAAPGVRADEPTPMTDAVVDQERLRINQDFRRSGNQGL